MVVKAAWRRPSVHVEFSDLQHARCREPPKAKPNFILQNRFCKRFFTGSSTIPSLDFDVQSRHNAPQTNNRLRRKAEPDALHNFI
jgi:hypothetical protein